MDEHTLVHIGYFVVGLFIGYKIAVWQVNKTLDDVIGKRLKEAKNG